MSTSHDIHPQRLDKAHVPEIHPPFDIRNSLQILDYREALRKHVRRLNLLDILSTAPPEYLIDYLYVAPKLAKTYIDPETPPEQWPKDLDTLLDAVAANPRLVILGDPGAGKSTLVNWIAWNLAQPTHNLWKERLGDLIPIPLVLRDLQVTKHITWDDLLTRFLQQPYAAPLRKMADPSDNEALAKALELLNDLASCGRLFYLLDGLDEIASVEVRTQLHREYVIALTANTSCRFLCSSRIVGYDAIPFHQPLSGFWNKPIDEQYARSIMRMMPDDWKEGLDNLHYYSSRDNAEILSFEQTNIDVRLEVEFSDWSHHLSIGDTDHEYDDILPPDIDTLTMQDLLEYTSLVPGFSAVLYLAPFDNPQMLLFLKRWYLKIRANEETANNNAKEVHCRVIERPGIARVARIANTLNLVAAIFEKYQTFPSGRALLYDDIAKAYLDVIDNRRRMEGHPRYLFQDQRFWLGHIAYQMQLKRAATGNEKETGQILVGESQAVQWLRQAMAARPGPSTDDNTLKGYLYYLHARSGLFIARGIMDTGNGQEEHYAFVHLSHQEYFAAAYLADHVILRDFGRGLRPIPGGPHRPNATELAKSAVHTPWHETLCLLFELLPSPEASRDLLADIFGEDFSRIPAAGSESRAHAPLVSLLINITLDAAVRWPADNTRHDALVACWRGALCSNDIHSEDWLEALPSSEALFNANEAELPAIGDALQAAWPLFNTRLNFQLCTGLTDLELVGNLKSLQWLSLQGCAAITDLEPVNNLKSLQRLSLRGCAALTDLKPIKDLKCLEWLSLYGCTAITDLEYIKNLNELQSLVLSHCTAISDLEPIRNLDRLQVLLLFGCKAIDNIDPIKNLNSLQTLNLSGCTALTDLEPIKNLNSLKRLLLDGCMAISDLDLIKKLKFLERLSLTDCKGLRDVSPIKNLNNLQALFLDGCTEITDWTPAKQLRDRGVNVYGIPDNA